MDPGRDVTLSQFTLNCLMSFASLFSVAGRPDSEPASSRHVGTEFWISHDRLDFRFLIGHATCRTLQRDLTENDSNRLKFSRLDRRSANTETEFRLTFRESSGSLGQMVQQILRLLCVCLAKTALALRLSRSKPIIQSLNSKHRNKKIQPHQVCGFASRTFFRNSLMTLSHKREKAILLRKIEFHHEACFQFRVLSFWFPRLTSGQATRLFPAVSAISQ